LPALPVHKGVLDVVSETLDAYTVKGSDLVNKDFDKKMLDLLNMHGKDKVKPSIDELMAMLLAIRATFPRGSGDESSDSDSVFE
jgi:hypothetical protein